MNFKPNATALICITSAFFSACSNPKDTPVPIELSKMESIKPSLEKLSQEERELFGKYMMRHSIGAAFGMAQPVPEGITIGKAIAEQQEFIAKEAAKAAEQKALSDKLKAEQEKAMSAMRDAVTVTVVSKSIRAEHGYSGMVMDEHLLVKFGYKNNTEKEISGVKGTVDIYDVFGDDLAGFAISNDTSIKPGASVTWVGSRSIRYGANKANDRKFSELSEDKYKVVWKPKMLVFADGSKMERP